MPSRRWRHRSRPRPIPRMSLPASSPRLRPTWRCIMLDAPMPNAPVLDAPVLGIEDLTVRFTRRNADLAAVNGVDFSLRAGETLTILGESGSGKSVSLKALMGLLPGYANVSGKVWLNGQEILGLPAAALAKLRGGAVSMIFQEPMAALDPVYT